MCSCLHLCCEADTGPDKAHEYSYTAKEREGPLAHAMGFRASASGKGCTSPWLQEKEEIARARGAKEAEAQAKAGSPSPQQQDPKNPGRVELQPRHAPEEPIAE